MSDAETRANLGDYSYAKVDRDLLGTLGMPSKRYIALIAFCLALVAWGGISWGYLVLTGMGSDGMRGGKDIVAAGGSVIAQDEASSVVCGMPGAVAQAGVCAAVLPLNQIAPKLVRVFSGARSCPPPIMSTFASS